MSYLSESDLEKLRELIFDCSQASMAETANKALEQFVVDRCEQAYVAGLHMARRLIRLRLGLAVESDEL